ncbi:MAG: ABC transporter substrate-binding protein [Paracoccaceae bacterium]|jgi:phospholipid transport system substrate-binding protein|nr:ABC transporter substrate-binding protein [Paracoccaceae bacterium]
MSNLFPITRRKFLSVSAGATAVVAVPLPALATTKRSAKKLVEKVVADINKVIDSGKSEPEMLADFEQVFVDYADVNTIARYALGVEARSASDNQLKAFTAAFQKYLSTKYGKRFREFIGGRVEVQDARAVKSFFEVKTVAYLQGLSPFEVTFLVSDRSGEEKFFNMFIEGLNMLLSERTEIGAMLDKRGGDLNKTITDLQNLN